MISLIPFFKGMGLGAGLIIAIGAQNAFILDKAIRGSHQYVVALICFLVDAILISAGILGVGTYLSSDPQLLLFTKWAGAIFLAYYGLRSFYSVLRPNSLRSSNSSELGLLRISLTTLAVSTLNPHVYIDTVLLLGGIGSQYPIEERYIFGAGAILASFLWFFSLAFGATYLAPLFEKKRSWQLLDFIIGIIMWWIAYSLINS